MVTNKKSNPESATSIIPEASIISIPQSNEQEEGWFTRANNLIEEFVGDPPIVYCSDLKTILKENQYGYIGDDAYKDNEELLADDVSLLPGAIKPPTYIKKTVDLLTAKQQFEERWARIQEEYIKEPVISEEEQDRLDHIAKVDKWAESVGWYPIENKEGWYFSPDLPTGEDIKGIEELKLQWKETTRLIKKAINNE